MKKLIFSLLVAFALLNSVSASDLSSQLNAVRQAELEGKRVEQIAAQKRAQKAEAQRRAARAEAEKKRAARAAAEQRAYEEYMQDKRREQSYEDKHRDLEIEMKKLELEQRLAEIEERKAMSKARSKRADDFVLEEINREKANTDVIQSEADSVRNISKGVGNLLDKEGDARIKKESGLFK